MLLFTVVNRSCRMCRAENWLSLLLNPVVLNVCVLYSVLGRWEQSQPLYPSLCSAALVFQETQPISSNPRVLYPAVMSTSFLKLRCKRKYRQIRAIFPTLSITLIFSAGEKFSLKHEV